jgi:hypothetical protein
MSPPVIALAVTPHPAEALPALLEALGGAGRPAGILTCECAAEGELRVRWDIAVTPASVVRALLAAEVNRFAGAYTTRLLEPLSVEASAMVAADGLQSSELTTDRILDVLVQRARRAD